METIAIHGNYPLTDAAMKGFGLCFAASCANGGKERQKVVVAWVGAASVVAVAAIVEKCVDILVRERIVYPVGKPGNVSNVD